LKRRAQQDQQTAGEAALGEAAATAEVTALATQAVQAAHPAAVEAAAAVLLV
jgi:hypothetical protein